MAASLTETWGWSSPSAERGVIVLGLMHLVLCTCRAHRDSLGSREVQDGAVAAVVHVLHGRTSQLAVLPGKLPR